jgi:uncharacterized peroxidase-related enzyme
LSLHARRAIFTQSAGIALVRALRGERRTLLPEFKVHTVESAPLASGKLLQGLKDQVGFVPNLAATMAESPTLLEAFLGLRSVAGRASLDPVAREILAIAVAAQTGCSYCVAAHSTFAVMNGATPGIVEAVRSASVSGDARFDALARFARAVAGREGNVKERVQDLRSAGLTSAQVLEALAVIAVPMLASSVFHITGVELDAAFLPQAWARTA